MQVGSIQFPKSGSAQDTNIELLRELTEDRMVDDFVFFDDSHHKIEKVEPKFDGIIAWSAVFAATFEE